MEYTPFGPQPFEAAQSESADKPDKEKKSTKKKSSRADAPVTPAADKKGAVERDIARSIDMSALFELPKADKPAKTEITADKTDAPEVVSNEESQHIERSIAADHLQAIEAADPEAQAELAPAAEFLERVASGEDSNEVFAELATELEIPEAEIAALSDETAEPEQEPTLEAPEAIDTSQVGEGELDLHSPAPVRPAAGGRGGAGTVPPLPPTGSGAGLPPRGPRVPRPQMGRTPNVLPAAANTHYEQRNKAGELLLIGLVGYLVGRRRGRLKTEKKLLPLQRNLEKQVTQLEQAITYKEQTLVVANARRQPARPTFERPLSRQDTLLATPVERMQQLGRPETRLGMQKPRAERLGHMIMAAESPIKNGEMAKLTMPNNLRQAVKAEAVKTMSRNELLEVSEKITVEGASLRRIYESRLIGEKQLRHLVAEYLNGKDIRKDLRREMVEREIDFERDPILRDRVRSHLSESKAGGGLAELLASVGIVDEAVDPALLKRQAAAEQQAAAKAQRQQRQRVLADSAMATAIVLLAIVIAVLVVRQ